MTNGPKYVTVHDSHENPPHRGPGSHAQRGTLAQECDAHIFIKYLMYNTRKN